MLGKGKAREAVSRPHPSSQREGRTSQSSRKMRRGSAHNCTRGVTARGGVERRAWAAPDVGTFFASTEEGVEGLGHDGHGARTAVSAGVGGMIAGPALCVGNDPSPDGKSEGFTIPFLSFSPQGLTVSNSTHNAGSHNGSSVGPAQSRPQKYALKLYIITSFTCR